MSEFDVAVIGAGPAGSWAAYNLGKAGVRVALIDGTHPREKPCGGGITQRAFDLVREALTPDAVGAVAIRLVAFGESTHQATVPLDERSRILVASRREFDGALRHAALAAGAHPVAAQATGIEATSGGWTIRFRDRRLTATWIFGADGANSLVRRRLSRAFARADLSIATGYYLDGCAGSDIRVDFEERPAGYLWSFPRRDHLAVGICAQADAATSASLLHQADAWIARELAGARGRGRRYSWPIPSLHQHGLRVEQPAGRNWLLLGDAAGLVDPITREGIYFALASAADAADCLLRERHVSQAYAHRIKTTIHAELFRAARLKGMFFRPQFTALLVDALRHSAAVRRIMADLIAGRQTYRGLRRRLLATCEFRLMARLLQGY